MRVAILTFVNVDNYGAVLQAYGLSSFLKQTYDSVEIINYNHLFNQKKNIKSYAWKFVKRLIAGNTKKNKFELFRKRELNLFPNCQITSREELQFYIDEHHIDKIIVGSDQVWNPFIHDFNDVFVLKDVDVSCKVSYAASFGKSVIPEKWLEVVLKELQNFKAVSVREETGKNILMNYAQKNDNICKNISVVLDPVFLLDQANWSDIEATPKYEEKYVLCYEMPGDSNLIKSMESSVKLIHKKYKLKVIYIGRKEYKKFAFGSTDMISAGPNDFLHLIKNAELIITNSFHGTAFSIIYKKNFYSFVNKDLSFDKQLGSRIGDLLTKVGLEDRIVQHLDKIERVNYNNVEDKLKNYIDKSKAFLQKI